MSSWESYPSVGAEENDELRIVLVLDAKKYLSSLYDAHPLRDWLASDRVVFAEDEEGEPWLFIKARRPPDSL